ncbi:alpha-amylase family glycosyl hydrolase [Photobacterium sp. OFAV2-7]|uniref:alpha-amylase family glycosyl hydrolase n=1 Tax=Photobacterium sp. OFAV2-7 TaxID=2917748 RepID=UPI001EF735BB|nr:alpha-amylase family glycosyl hydrolase [Photobacterium sp. OFAV2-7]MCG7586575.1 alpha-amylase family glycosyl hydrolase [Photobacterium sp. OFAV2-7]
MDCFNHPEWTKDKNIYEVNLRQFSQEGTINAFMEHLPRLKAMGIDILWLMPIHPVGEKERKGTLGSQYAAKDYLALDPALGTTEDLKKLVATAHEMGMYLIIDWVANHTAWDNVWVDEHPDWYKRNEKGELYPYTYVDEKKTEYWTDVLGLNYENRELWQGMTDAMAYWVREFDIDGFRCDVAGLVPTSFWEFATEQLNQIKHLFMLAEWSSPDLHDKAFDMTYDWGFYELMGAIARGEKTVSAIPQYIDQLFSQYPADAYRMLFTTNHDKNTWEASDAEFFGDSFKAFAVLAATLYGMPLIYNGQESYLDKRLEFFEKDPIDWKDFALQGFYANLLKLKHDNCALWNGPFGAMPTIIYADNPSVITFVREKGSNRVEVTINLSADVQHYKSLQNRAERTLEPFQYIISTTH